MADIFNGCIYHKINDVIAMLVKNLLTMANQNIKANEWIIQLIVLGHT